MLKRADGFGEFSLIGGRARAMPHSFSALCIYTLAEERINERGESESANIWLSSAIKKKRNLISNISGNAARKLFSLWFDLLLLKTFSTHCIPFLLNVSGREDRF